MGVLVTIGAAIASAVAAAAVAIASAIAAIMSAIITAIASIASAIYAGVSAVISYVGSAISAISAKIASSVSYFVSHMSVSVTEIASKVYHYAHVLYTSIHEFAEVIHLKLLLKIHKIAYILSDDYRNMMNKFYRKFAEVSEQLGLGPQFINLAIRNARSIVLDVSSMMGRPYDLGEITWLKSLSGFTKKIQNKLTTYGDHPEELFQDIDNLLVRDSVDTGAHVQQTILTGLEKATQIIDTTVQNVVKVRNDVNQIISDLPEKIRDEIGPYIDPFVNRVDNFLKDEYAPYKRKMDNIIGVLNNNQKTVKNRVDGIVDRLTKPGDVLAGIDNLPYDTKIAQEDKISEVSTRAPQRQEDKLHDQTMPAWEELKKIREALQYPPRVPEYVIPERRKILIPPGEQSKQADTWFVGDY